MNASAELDCWEEVYSVCVCYRGTEWGCRQPIDLGHICDAGTDEKEAVLNY